MTSRVVQLAVLMAVIASGAMADPIIDFSGGSNGKGSISSLGVGSTVVGTNIEINLLRGTGTAQNADTKSAVTSGFLSFTTGTISSFDAKTLTYTYKGGGSFKITGSVAAAGIGAIGLSAKTPVTPTTLLEGTFYDGSFSILGAAGGYVVMMQGVAGTDSLNPALLKYFGIADAPFTFGGFSMASNILGDVGKNGAFDATAFSSDIANTMAPEPSAILIMGTCLLFVGAQLRKRLLGA